MTNFEVKTNPLMIFALDSADPKLIKKFMADGDMPNLQELAQRGSQAIIKDRDTIIELGIYNIIFSGEPRNETGYYDFRQLIPGTYKIKHHVDGTDFGRDPFWGNLKQTDKSVFVMDVFDARLVPDVKGIQIANWGVNNMKRPMTALPASIVAEVESWGERIFANQQMPATFTQSKSIYQQMMLRLDKKVDRVLHLLEQDKFDVIVIGFGEVHGATHQFWQYRAESAEHHPEWQSTELTDAIRNIYQKTDECIGKIIASLPPDANTFVISHCGFKDQYPVENLLNNFCVGLDYQKLKQPSVIEKLHPFHLIRSIFPLSWRIAFSRKFLNTQQRDGILSDKFEYDTDWEKTTLFDMSSMFTAFLRVNLN
jgi:predicted AlkP superfamily phosphohydrolase/phosphomutase